MYNLILMVSLLCSITVGYFYVSANKLLAGPEVTEEIIDPNESVQLETNEQDELEILGQTAEAEITNTSIEETESSHLAEEVEGSVFIGETIEVSTFEDLRLAVANPDIGQIDVQNDLVRSGTGTGTAIGTLNRNLLIKGNGYIINFGANNGSLTLGSLATGQEALLRVENASLIKDGATSIFNASGTGIGWSLELEDVNTGTGNASRLALIPAGRLTFTGGVNTFAQTLTNIFVEAKEIYVQNQAQVSITRGNSAVFYSAATIADPKIVISENSNVSISVARGTAVAIEMRGTNPSVVVSEESTLEINALGTGGTVSNTSNNAIVLNGAQPTLDVLGNSKLLVTTSESKRAIFLNGISAELKVASSVVNVNSVNGRGIHLSGNDSKVDINSKSTSTIVSGAANGLTLHGERPSLRVADSGTELNASSTVGAGYVNAAIYLGSATANSLTLGARVEITDGAQVQATSNLSSAMGIQSRDGNFLLADDASLKLNSGASAGEAAVLRFLYFGSYNFTIDNALLEISKSGGNSPGIRMYGGNNHIEVKNGGMFRINNPGNGSPNDTANQGVLYTTNNAPNSFTVSDPGSSVIINAATGPSIDMGTGTGTIDVLNQGYFQAAGRTNSANGGIFNAGNLSVTFDNPLYMNFRNNRPAGGNIFNVSNGSTLTATNSDLAVWRNGVDLDGDPNINYRTLDYSFSGLNFNTLASTNNPDILNTGNFGTTGLTAYSRLSSNNARWAIADELRVPTNADKKIYGHISIPVGLYESRSAWDDEAEVSVEVTKSDGSTQNYRAKSVGHSDENPGISIYGEEPRGGLFEITLNDYLEAGDKVEVKEVRLTSGELTPGFENTILSDPAVTFPIVPPTPAAFDNEIVLSTASTIKGHSENRDVEITATHNGQPIDTSNVTIDNSGNFDISVSELTLLENDKIQVFLRDKAGLAETAGVVNL